MPNGLAAWPVPLAVLQAHDRQDIGIPNNPMVAGKPSAATTGYSPVTSFSAAPYSAGLREALTALSQVTQ